MSFKVLEMKNFQNLNLYQKLNFICVSIQAFLGLIGIASNILAIFVLKKKTLNSYPYSLYWRIMACSDILILLHTFRHWTNFVLDFDLNLVSTFFCKTNDYQPFVASCLSTWLLALISFDRLSAIVYPRRFKTLKKRWFQIILVLILITYSLLVNIQLPIYYRLEERNDTMNSTYVCHLPIHILNISSLIALLQIILVNVVINNALLLKIIHFIYFPRGSNNAFVIPLRSFIRNRKVVFSTIVLNTSSLLYKMGAIITLYIATAYEFDSDKFQLLYSISVTISIIDNCDLFFISMFFNSMFYEEFFKMIR